MISCRDFIEEIGEYLDGETAVEVRQRLEEHLAHCKTCTVICDSARKTIRVVTESDSFDLDDGEFLPIADKIMERIRLARE